jgi:hypothetical protein
VPDSLWSNSKRLCAGAVALTTLAGCPQLLDDDFSPGPLTTDPGGGGSNLSGGAGGSTFNMAGAGAAGSGGSVTGQGGADLDSVERVRQALAHRYRFDGTGEAAVDEMGGEDGQLFNTSLDGRGFVDLVDDGQLSFVNLPNGYLSSSDDKTIECWLTWRGGEPWQRIFDFGSSDQGEAARGDGASYFFLTPRALEGSMMVGYSRSGIQGEIQLVGTSAFPMTPRTHVAVVVDSGTNAFSLYVDGELNATQTLEQRLSEVDDVNSWLGISQYAADPNLNAELHEFRIYERALTAEEVRLTYELGPDTL